MPLFAQLLSSFVDREVSIFGDVPHDEGPFEEGHEGATASP